MAEKGINFFGRVIFSLNVFIALMIIVGAGALVRTDFGKVSMIFGFVLLAVSTVLKLANAW